MIARLKGQLALKSPEGLLVDIHGVGYRVMVSLNAFADLPAEGQPVELQIHTHMRESSLELFGFVDQGEKALFTQLLSVSGVGPRIALTILSGVKAADLVTALVEGDVKRLVGIPGVGKRKAERLIVELQDKVLALGIAPSGGSVPRPPGAEDEAVSALVNLGYRPAESEEAVRRAIGDGSVDLAVVIREALKVLSG